MIDEASLQWLYGRQALGIKLGLDNMRQLLGRLDDPQRIPAIHVAGTNGKGSTCHFIARILEQAGYRVGLYTSPHLLRFEERVRVQGEPAVEDIQACWQELVDAVDGLDAEGIHPTFFEVVTALAWLVFRRTRCEVVVLETGMGGRLDATNVCEPILSVITSVGLDHVRELGPEIMHIAMEKAGIIKPGVPVITATQDVPLGVIQSVCRDRGSPLEVLTSSEAILVEEELLYNRAGHAARYHVPRLPSYQAANLGMAVTAAKVLQELGWTIPEQAIQLAMAGMAVPGRFQAIHHPKGIVLLDPAHNPPAAEALAHAMMAGPATGWHLVFGCMADKNWQEVLRPLLPFASMVYAVEPNNPRRMEADRIADFAKQNGVPAIAYPATGIGVDAAKSTSDHVLVFGSFFTVAEALAHLQGHDGSGIRGNQ